MVSNCKEPLVTIAIPTYNRAKSGKLLKVIEHSLNQTYENLEIIVSDNCSEDNTQDIMHSIQDNRLKYYRQESNIGPNGNFNFCLQQATGKYFLLFHDDDAIDPDFITTCISAIKPDQEAGIVFTGVRVVDENDCVTEEHENMATGLTGSEFVFSWFSGNVSLFLCNTLYNTQYLKNAGGFQSKHQLYDDLIPTFNLVSNYERVDVHAIKASFRRHSTNRGLSVPIRSWVDESQYLLKTLCNLYPEEKDSIWDTGSVYFSKKLYRKSLQRSGVVFPIINCLRVYSTFRFRVSPIQFIYRLGLQPRLSRVKHFLSQTTSQRFFKR